MTIDLKLCPFCGDTPELRYTARLITSGGDWERYNPEIICERCGLKITLRKGIDTPEELSERWNRRPDTPLKTTSAVYSS